MRSPNLLHSFRCAFAGLAYALREQRNVRIHAVVTFAVVGLGLWLRISFLDWAVLVLTIGFVLVSEMANTALEVLVDLVSPEYHPLAGIVKDVAAGTVLLTAIISVIVGLLVLGPPLWERLFGV
jgi:diacylglycerol kinase